MNNAGFQIAAIEKYGFSGGLKGVTSDYTVRSEHAISLLLVSGGSGSIASRLPGVISTF